MLWFPLLGSGFAPIVLQSLWLSDDSMTDVFSRTRTSNTSTQAPDESLGSHLR
jgi:hypothetical protein